MSGTNAAVINLADLCRKWADDVASRHRTRVKYIDLFAQRGGADQRYKLSYGIKSIDYGTAVTRKLHNSFAFQSYASNASPNPSTAVLSKSEQTQSSFTWYLKETLKITGKETVKGKIGLPLLAEGEAQTEISVEFDVESQQQWTTTTTETWTVQQTVTLAANLETVYTWIINKEEIDCPFTIAVGLSGNIAVWFEDKIDLNNQNGQNLHWLWYPSIATIASQLRNPNLVLTGSGANLLTHGTFAGIGATTNYVDIKTYPIGTVPPKAQSSVTAGGDLTTLIDSKPVSEKKLIISEQKARLPVLKNAPVPSTVVENPVIETQIESGE